MKAQEGKKMRTNYKQITSAMDRLIHARNRVNRIAQLRMNMIHGGPSIASENAEYDAARNQLRALVEIALTNGCRISRLTAAVNNDLSVADLIKYPELYR